MATDNHMADERLELQKECRRQHQRREEYEANERETYGTDDKD